jgi:hypothetical protein
MICESYYWKRDLLRRAQKLQKHLGQKLWSEASLANLEQTLMLRFYSVRKLHEARKLSTLTMKQQIVLRSHPCRKMPVTKLNWHNLDELYDLDKKKKENRGLSFICNQMIHSFIFSPNFDEFRHLEGVYFASEKQRHKSLLYVSIEGIASLFELVGNDYPSSAQYTWNPETNDYDVEATNE